MTMKALSTRLDRLEEKAMPTKRLFAAMRIPRDWKWDQREINAAICRDIPEAERAKAVSIVTITTGIARAPDDPPEIGGVLSAPRVGNWFLAK